MATEYIEIHGKCKWFKARDLDQYGKWNHQFFPDAPSLEKIRELQADGAKNVVHKDEVDGYWLNIHRRPFVEKKDGTKVPLSPPYVKDGAGHPFTGNVGNGSDITTTLEVYQHHVPNTTKKAKAFRWFGSRIDNLVPYDKSSLPPEDVERDSKVGTSPAPSWS